MEDRGLQVRFQAMADAVPVLIWVTDAAGGHTFLNQGWLEFTGRKLEQELGNGWRDNVHPDDVDRCVSDIRLAFERREPFETEYRLRRADGAWRWILARAVPLADADGELTGFVGSGIDLTERREADRALDDSRAELAAAQAAARMGAFTVELATGRITRDRNLDLLYGLEPGQATTMEEWAALIHEDDRAHVLGEVERVTAEGGAYHLEHRMVRADGGLRWIERRGEAYRDASGQVAGLRGMAIDVTERKVAEEERAVLFERVSRLQAVTAALATAGTVEEVLETMVREGIAALGATAGSIALLDPDGPSLDVVRAVGYPADVRDASRRIELTAPVPLAEAARSGAPVACRNLDEWRKGYPDLVPESSGSGHQAIAAFPLLVDEQVIGTVGLSFDRPQPFDRAQVEFLEAVTAQCAQALARALSHTAEATARRTAEQARARLALLADASIVLAGSMEYETTLPAVARLAIPLLGDCCVIDVFDDGTGERWRRVAVASIGGDVVEKVLAAVPPSAWEAAAGPGGVLDVAGLDFGSVAVVPLRARGRTLGMLTLGCRTPSVVSSADRSLATALGTRVAQAVDNALLYRAERQAHEEAEGSARRLLFLLDVSTTLAAPLERQDRLERLAQQSVEAIADLCLIDLAEPDGSIHRVAAASADPSLQDVADAMRDRLHPDPQSRLPAATAIRFRRTEVCPEITDERLRAITLGASHLDLARAMRPISYVAVPLVGRTRVLGAITLVTTERSGRRYGPADVALVEDLATRVAMGLESARMHEEMRRVAQTLQAGLLPAVPPEIPGLEVGTRYLAAGEGTVVGGDFFDVFATGPDSWAVVVGDVCGQGVEAATVTGLARHTVRSHALEHDSPTAVLSHLNDVLLSVRLDANEAEPRFCTVCLVCMRTTARGATVTLALGGHPLPFVLAADGTVRQIGQPGSLLGVVERAVLQDETHELGPGDALILYTDGITERHHGTSFFGEDGIARALATSAGLTADEIAGRIEEAARGFVHGQPSDDMAVVVVRVPPR